MCVFTKIRTFFLGLHTVWYFNNILFSIFAHLSVEPLKQMETIKHEKYEAPTINVIVVKAEGAILTVSGDAPQYEGPEEF